MLPPRDVLHQAHDQTIFAACIDDKGRNLALPKGLEGFQAALPANKLITEAIRMLPSRNGNWLLKTKLGDIRHDLLEISLVAHPRIDDVDQVNRDHLDGRSGILIHHATSKSLARAAIPNSGS